MIEPAISFWGVSIHWYGIILAASVFSAYIFTRSNSWRFGVSPQSVDDYGFWVVIAGIAGARIYFVLFSYEYYLANPFEIYAIWHGGLSIYGAIIAGIIFTYFYTKNKAFSFIQLFDLTAISLPLSQAIGRLGNFINQEAYGTVTDLPWKIFIEADGQYHHPTFLYEMIWDVAVFFMLWVYLRKNLSQKFPGLLGLMYLFLYSFGRFFIEAIRTDSFIYFGLRVDQVLALIVVIITGMMIMKLIRARSVDK